MDEAKKASDREAEPKAPHDLPEAQPTESADAPARAEWPGGAIPLVGVLPIVGAIGGDGLTVRERAKRAHQVFHERLVTVIATADDMGSVAEQLREAVAGLRWSVGVLGSGEEWQPYVANGHVSALHHGRLAALNCARGTEVLTLRLDGELAELKCAINGLFV